MNRRSARWFGASLLAVSLVAASCGDDKKSSDTTTAAATETTAAATETTAAATETTAAADTTVAAGTETTVAGAADTTVAGAAADGAAGLETARARVAEFKKDATDLGITEAVAVPDKLKVAYVQCSVPVCESIRLGIAEAVNAAGGELVTFPHKDSADTVQAAFQAAVQSNPSMVLTSGNPREWFEQELAQLNEKKIPVIAWSIPEEYKPAGIAANLLTGDDYYFNGVLMADYVTDKTEGKANVLFINIPQFPVLGLEGTGFADEYAKVCPGCKITKVDVTVDQLLAGGHIQSAVSELQKDGTINYIVTGFGDMLLGMPDALKAAGFDKVPAVSQAGTPANYGLIAGDQMQTADVGLATGYLGWRALDSGLRAIAGQDVGVFPKRPQTDIAGHDNIQISGMPLKILEKADIADPAVSWSPVADFQSLFKALWGKA